MLYKSGSKLEQVCKKKADLRTRRATPATEEQRQTSCFHVKRQEFGMEVVLEPLSVASGLGTPAIPSLNVVLAIC